MPIRIDELEDELDDDDVEGEEIHASMPAQVELKIDGVQIDWTIESLELDQMAFDHHSLKIYLSKDIEAADPLKHLTAMNFFPAKMGSSLTLIIKATEEFLASQNPTEFFGVITNLRFINTGTSTGQVLVEAKSPTWKMGQASRLKMYEEMSRADIAQQLLGQYSIENQLSAGGGTSVNRKMTTQWMQSDWDFLLTTVLGETNRWVYYDGKKLVVDEAKSKDTVKLELMVNVGSAELRMNALQTKFTQTGWDPAQKAASVAPRTSSPTSFSGMASHAFRASQELISAESIGISEFSAIAADVNTNGDAIQNDALGKLVTCHLQTNQPSVKVGNTVELTGMGPVYNGVYFVKRVTHCMDGPNGYYNWVEALPLESAKPPMIESAARSWHADPMPAIVTDNNDPEKLSRVKVKFPTLDTEESFWVRVVAPHAGNNRGFYFMPEVDDEVIVGFLYGDADNPVVLGSVWNGIDKPQGNWVTDRNDKKVICTRSGHILRFDDTDGSEKIEIIDKTGKNSIVIDSAENTITVSADKDIVLKAKRDIKMQADGNIDMTAKGKVTMKADQDLSAEGMNVTAKAQAQMKLEGTAGLEAKGAKMDLTAQGPNTVKGNPIMLN